MTIDRTTIIQGPAVVTYGGQSFFSKGDVAVKPMAKRFTLSAAHVGKIEERNIDLRCEITFEPAGQITAALALVLWPYGTTLPGTSIFGSTDSALVVHGRDGVKVTFHNAALTQMPALRIGTNQSPLGPVKFTALLKNSADPAVETSYWTWATTAYPGDAGFDPSQILTVIPTGGWSQPNWDSLPTESGWEFTFGLSLNDISVDGLGTVNMIVTDVTAGASCIPVGIVPAEATSSMHRNTGMGTSPQTTAMAVLGAAAGDPSVSFASAFLADAEIVYGVTRKRVGRCTWQAMRTFAVGVAAPLFEVGVVPEPEPEE
jgi:hypothetical protein